MVTSDEITILNRSPFHVSHEHVENAVDDDSGVIVLMHVSLYPLPLLEEGVRIDVDAATDVDAHDSDLEDDVGVGVDGRTRCNSDANRVADDALGLPT